jgi:predicted dehydrogenase
MAREYAKVLLSLDHNFEVIGRGPVAAGQFQSMINRPVRPGGLQRALAESGAPELAIVAVGVEALADAAAALIEAGTRRLLVEKPGGLNTQQIQALHQTAKRHGANVLLAYNRRFYASVTRARELIAEDGGPTSCMFEFTEWSHVIAPLYKAPGVKAAWFLANSTHVVDLAFHLCGFPKEWQSWRGGSSDWHPAAARFCGSGITDRGVFFSYHADWEAPGRWGVDVNTRRNRFILRPMEQLHVVRSGSTRLESLTIDDRHDKAFKPGLFAQTRAFLEGDDHLVCTLEEQLQHCVVYDEMAGYGH